MVLNGPTVTARRTAAVSLLAAQVTGFTAKGSMLIVGAGVQGRAHLDAFHEGLGIDSFLVASRSSTSADALVAYAQDRGLHAQRVDDPNAVLEQCAYVVTTTTANGPVMHEIPADGSFVAAVGAFTPEMSEWSVNVCQTLATTAQLVVDTPDAIHEAGDLHKPALMLPRCPLWRKSLPDRRHGAPLSCRRTQLSFLRVAAGLAGTWRQRSAPLPIDQCCEPRWAQPVV